MKMRKFLLGACLAMLTAGNGWSRGIDTPPALVVLPARQRVIEFGFDLIRQQQATLIAYQQVGPDLLIHLWNGREWVPMTPAVYFSGTFLLGAPDQLILVGDDNLLPSIFQTLPDWSRKTERIRALDIASLVNQFGALLGFSDGQWKWFADKYDLTLTDSNAARRRWGKYGPPGQEWYRKQPPAKGEIRPIAQPPSVAAPAPAESAPTLLPATQVIPDNAPVQAPVAPVAPAPAAPVAPVVVAPAVAPAVPVVQPPVTPAATAPVAPVPAEAPAPVPQAEPAKPVEPAPAVPVVPVAVPAAPAKDVLPPGTQAELPVK